MRFRSLLITMTLLWGGIGLEVHAETLRASDLQPGDVLLQPLDCWSCTLIEEEEQSIYSHVGMVLSVLPETGEVRVVEALSRVRKLSLEAFASRNEAGQAIRVLRLRDLEKRADFARLQDRYEETYRADFDGLPYDHQFLWENRTSDGRELIYCSELVAKLHERFLGIVIPPKRMHFDRNVEQWRRYFRGEPPRGEWGLSPGDLERSPLFVAVGDLR